MQHCRPHELSAGAVRVVACAPCSSNGAGKLWVQGLILVSTHGSWRILKDCMTDISRGSRLSARFVLPSPRAMLQGHIYEQLGTQPT